MGLLDDLASRSTSVKMDGSIRNEIHEILSTLISCYLLSLLIDSIRVEKVSLISRNTKDGPEVVIFLPSPLNVE